MPNPPESICVNTGDQHLIQPKIDGFLKEVYDEICTKDNLEEGDSIHPYFEIKTAEIERMGGQISSDRMTYLMYKEKVVAIVLETRTSLNHFRYDFFFNDK